MVIVLIDKVQRERERSALYCCTLFSFCDIYAGSTAFAFAVFLACTDACGGGWIKRR